ncbi:MAG: tyrosine-protein phosphatase [Acidobacteria bacterium]|nr:tyrosine-protein phosphatase [Acidobacteriota bacterium]
MIKRYFGAFSSSLVFVLALAAASFAQSTVTPTAPSDFPGIKIKNFGRMDAHFYRGERPSKKDFASLKALGIDTIIDLTDNTPDEKGYAEAAGLKYINIAIPDKSYPTDDAVAKFLSTVNDPATGVFYVHCAGGRHRTGDMGAVYRLNHDGWNYDQVYAEMLNYDFYTSNGHQKALDFVVDYSAKITAQRAAGAAAATAATGTAHN